MIDFDTKALDDIEFWKKTNPKIVQRIQSLLTDIQKTPSTGIGNPEQLRYQLTGLWSRRIDRKHRLIYSFDEQMQKIIVKSCKGHYS